MFAVIVCVIEPTTEELVRIRFVRLYRKDGSFHGKKQLFKLSRGDENTLKGAYRDPQWQKSEETEKKLLGSSTYLASKRPYAASLSALRAPTKMGTIFTGCLHFCFSTQSNFQH